MSRFSVCRYTQNYKGAAYGWAAKVDQIRATLIPQISSVPGLFLAGHWATSGMGQSGVQGVSASGRKAAELVLKHLGKEWAHEPLRV